MVRASGWDRNFNPPTSCEVGPLTQYQQCPDLPHFNPPTSCEVGLQHDTCTDIFTLFQSTHLLRGGTIHPTNLGAWDHISIHPPPARWDARNCDTYPVPHKFQSTHLLRGGTIYAALRLHISKFQSTHLLRGGTESTTFDQKSPSRFQSTHLLRGGTRPGAIGSNTYGFQSTHLLRGGTLQAFHHSVVLCISIHPPPARWDTYQISNDTAARNFNPPTSCEVGPPHSESTCCTNRFQSTHLLRGGTYMTGNMFQDYVFQSTHLLRGGTRCIMTNKSVFAKFQSTHLLRGGTNAIRCPIPAR